VGEEFGTEVDDEKPGSIVNGVDWSCKGRGVCDGMVGKDSEREVADWKANGGYVRFVDEVVEDGIGEGAGVEISPSVAGVGEAVFLDTTGCLAVSRVGLSS